LEWLPFLLKLFQFALKKNFSKSLELINSILQD